MWQCKKCGEESEDVFDACWNCGTSMDGIEASEFHVEPDGAQAESDGTNHRNGFWFGAFVTLVVGFVDLLVPYLVAVSNAPSLRGRVGDALMGAAIRAILLAIGGGIAGWIGSKACGIVPAACKGAVVLFVTQGVLTVLCGDLAVFFEMSIQQVGAVCVNVSALGAVAGTIGAVFAKPRHRDGETIGRMQFTLSEALFVMVLFSILFASLIPLTR